MKDTIYIKAINEALREELARDENVILLGEDVGKSGGSFSASKGLYQEFGGGRVVDTPLCESSFVGMGLGMAISGLRPIIEIMFMDFITTCMDPLVNQIAKAAYMSGSQYKVPLVLRTCAGGGLSAGPQHSQSLESWFCHVPGLKVVYPATPYDVKGLLKSSVRDDNPVIFIEHKLLKASGQVEKDDHCIPLGQADVKRQGSDVSLVTWGPLLFKALSAADKLAEQGFSVEVIDLRTLSPLDIDTVVESVKKTNRLVIAHEAVTFAGFGAEVATAVMENAFFYLDAPIVRVGAPFSPVPFGNSLEKAMLPQEEQIIAAVKQAAQGM